jgi:ribonuclease P protein component
VYDAKLRKSSGPLLVFTRPNDLAYHRLGLSVSRKVGNAVRRNRVKRMLREAFRLTRHGWPSLDEGGLDLVVVVRPHEPVPLAEYQDHLARAVEAATRGWAKRRPTPH